MGLQTTRPLADVAPLTVDALPKLCVSGFLC